jgi:hypothetical protein
LATWLSRLSLCFLMPVPPWVWRNAHDKAVKNPWRISETGYYPTIYPLVN